MRCNAEDEEEALAGLHVKVSHSDFRRLVVVFGKQEGHISLTELFCASSIQAG